MIILSNNPAYSTTRLLSTERPQLDENQPGQLSTRFFLPEGVGRKGEDGLRIKGFFKHSYKKQDDQWVACDAGGLPAKTVTLPISPQYDQLPLITVVTVVYNGAAFLEETIQSVINQTYPNVEYIVIDGGSTDGTLDIIRKYEQAIDYWVSEKDAGIYDAMNKGVSLANGGWIYFLGADDKIFSKNTFGTVFRSIADNIMIVYGNVSYNDGSEFDSVVNYKMFFVNKLHHQATFYNVKIFKSFRYDLSYPVVSDYELNLRSYIKALKNVKIDCMIAQCGDFGISKTNFELNNYLDYFRIRRKYTHISLNIIYLSFGLINLYVRMAKLYMMNSIKRLYG